MSKTGIYFSGAYVAAVAACVAVAYFVVVDGKARFLILQLPIALQGAFIENIGLGFLFDAMNWWLAYVVLAAPVALALYAIGSLLDRIARR